VLLGLRSNADTEKIGWPGLVPAVGTQSGDLNEYRADGTWVCWRHFRGITRHVSGLSRPDYFDWPAHIADQLPEVNPDAVVVMFGGNDAQDVELGGERFDVGTRAWVDLYAIRVAEAMDVLLSGTERVYWIGLPIMKSDRFTTNAQTMNAAYESEADVRPAVTYVSSFELFTDADGEYNAYLDGKLMRFTDGAHFVWNGAYRLADAVLPVIAADWNIDLAG